MDSLLNVLKRAVPGMNKTDSFDIVVFGATTLHLLHVGPHRPFEFPKLAFGLEENIHKAAADIRDQGSLAVFITVHSICDTLFQGLYKDWIHSGNVTVDSSKVCESFPNDRQRRICEAFTLTEQGSKAAAMVERRALDSIANPPAVLDAFNITKGACWASVEGDGRHYIPLLPLQIQRLSGIVCTNLRLGCAHDHPMVV
jgi:hypothetical protein